MSTNINLKNSTDTTFSITHSDGANTKVIDSKDIAVAIDTVADFPANPNNGDVVIVRDLNRGGTFIYDSSEVAGSNDGTNFDGWIRQYSGAVNVKWFGAVGDGIVDDTVAIQSAILCKANNNISFIGSETYYITQPLLIVTNTIINGNNCLMKGNNKINDCFRTAYYVGGVLTDLVGLPVDTAFLYNTHIKQFRFNNFNVALNVRGLTSNCSIEDVFSTYCTMHINSQYNYFLTIRRSRADYCGTQTTGVPVANRTPAYSFSSLNGAMTFDNVSASSTQLGFAFDYCQATDISHLDCESVDVAIKFTGYIQNVKITSGYFENVGTVIYVVGSIVEGLDFSNNFCNYIDTSIINVQSSRIDRYNDFSNQKINVVADSIGVPTRSGVSTINTPKYSDQTNHYPADNTPNGITTNTNVNYYGKSGIDTRANPLQWTSDGDVIAKAISYEGGIVPSVYYGQVERTISNVIPFCSHSAVNQLGDFTFSVKIKTSIKFNELCFTAFSLQLINEHTSGFFKGLLVGTNILSSYKSPNFPNVTIVPSVEDNVLVISLVGILNSSHSMSHVISGTIKII